MANEQAEREVADIMRRINQGWRAGRTDEISKWIHPEIVVVFPGFSGQLSGREPLLGSMKEFSGNATQDFLEKDHRVDVVDSTAVVTYTYEMVYARGSEKYRAHGRDLWVFEKQGGTWIAVWRTMMDLQETPVP